MQIYDLTGLRLLENRPFILEDGSINLDAPTTLQPTAFYPQFGNCHNIVINEETGFAYAVGTGTCSGGLHMVDIQNPVAPAYAGCFSTDGYTHDAQCVIYSGPDTRYTGHEICFAYNEDTLTIVDVSVKPSPVQLARQPYAGSQYTHQGWLFIDQSHLLLNDELDEIEGDTPGGKTRTMLWDVTDLTAPKLASSYYSQAASIDHNLYIVGNTAYLANYCDGLRVLDISDTGNIVETGYFEVAPYCKGQLSFQGSWSSYPYFKSGTIIISSIERGLFVVTPSPA